MRWLAVLALSAAVALAGCGQSAEEHFRVHDLRPLTQQLQQRQGELAAVLQAAHPGRKRDARAVADAVQAVAGTAARLRGLRPPGSVRDKFARYAAANTSLVKALDRFAIAMRGTDQSRLAAASDAARNAAGAVRRTEDALEAALTKG